MEKPDKPYDNGIKRLLNLRAQDFLDWLNPGTVFTGKCSEAFQSLAIDADAIHEARRADELELTHVEIQSTPDANIEQRLLEYNILAFRRYQQFVNSYVIFLREGGENLKPPLVRRRSDGRQGLWFLYEVVIMRHKTPEEVLAAPRGIWTLIPFAKGGAQREVVEEVITQLISFADADTKELVSLTGLFASLAFTRQEDQQWLERKLAMVDDILSEAPLYKKLVAQGKEEGLRKGLEQGLEQGLERGIARGKEEGFREGKKQGLEQGGAVTAHKVILALFHERFPQLNVLAQRTVPTLWKPDILEQLAIKIALAKDEDEAQKHLVAALKQDG